MEKFRTNLETEIVKCKVVKETKTRITFEKITHSWRTNEDEIEIETENIISPWHSWHNTFEEAKLFLIKRHNEEILKHNTEIEYAKEKIKAITAITE